MVKKTKIKLTVIENGQKISKTCSSEYGDQPEDFFSRKLQYDLLHETVSMLGSEIIIELKKRSTEIKIESLQQQENKN